MGMHWGGGAFQEGGWLLSFLLGIPSPTSFQSWEALMVCELGDGAREDLVTGRENLGKGGDLGT